MAVRAKYTTEFTIKNGRVAKSRVIGEEVANELQKKAIAYVKPLLAKFVRDRLTDEIQFQDCVVNVRTSYVETNHGLEVTFTA